MLNISKGKDKELTIEPIIGWRSYAAFYGSSKLILFLAISGLIIIILATNFRTLYNFNMINWATSIGVNKVDAPMYFDNYILFAILSVSFLMIATATFFVVCLLVGIDLFTKLNESLMTASISKFYHITPTD